jgi:hypothetical protein
MSGKEGNAESMIDSFTTLCFLFVRFCCTGTQGFALVRQVLYYLSHVSSPLSHLAMEEE